MTLIEIKRAVADGLTVCWCGKNYQRCSGCTRGILDPMHEQRRLHRLTWMDGETLNGSENEFFTA
jgi:hypothetical protein